MLLYLTRRMISILKKIAFADGYITSHELAQSMGVTSRTIREDIKIINDKIQQHGAAIRSERSKGFKFYSESSEAIETLIQNIELEHIGSNLNVVTPEDRTKYIIKRILYSKEGVTIQTLADELYISDSTVKSDLSNVKDILNRYNIKVSKTNNGILADGNEINKRFCISDYFISRHETSSDFIITLINSLGHEFSQADIKILKEIILNEFNTTKVDIADEVLDKIAVHLIITIARIKNGQFIHSDGNLILLKKENEYKKAVDIKSKIEKHYDITMPEEETAYITLHLTSNRLFEAQTMPHQEMKYYLGKDIYNLSNQIIKDTMQELKELNILKDDEALIYDLGLHLKQLVTRLQYNMNIRNPLLQKVKIKYPLAFETGVISAKYIEMHTGFQISENEIGFLALHFGLAIERQKLQSTEQKKIALICASGMAASSLLLSKLSYVLNNEYKLTGAYALRQLDEVKKQNPDIILTTVTIQEDLSIPVYQIPSILDDRDVSDIGNYLKRANINKNTFSKFFNEDLFYPALNVTTKEETLTFMTEDMIHKGYINNNIKASILEREQLSPTSIGNMVAIPHPLEINAEKSFVGTAILREPILWSPDEYVKLVLIIILEKRFQSRFQEIFSSLYDVVHLYENVEMLSRKKTFTQFYEAVNSIN